MTENDDCNVHGAEDGELVRLLKETAFALEECSVERISTSPPPNTYEEAGGDDGFACFRCQCHQRTSARRVG